MIRCIAARLCAVTALLAAASTASAVDYYYVGLTGGDFFEQNNWNDSPDGLGSFLATPVIDLGTGDVEHSLIVDGDMVAAAADIDFGMGSLTLDSGSSLTVSGSEITFGSGSSLTMIGSSLMVDGGSSGQIELNSGSSASFTGANVVATDDIFFRSNVSIVDSYFESTVYMEDICARLVLDSECGESMFVQGPFISTSTT
ncbi:hypothetical protein Mal64_26840 [Pseudobythopirellula maris]|uniref:Autotransporter-associated beta strand repeat protein n=1 Tax=Pseudobythopirellula maris TaxID=2527991 RepID=A0A5C5ZIB7_9BACT|nr:hypothetical protein [Pseudobythopirellula maris]TWT87149.1 hypothetical protein Mal64_26840 [Pseudobythopirellula maris]